MTEPVTLYDELLHWIETNDPAQPMPDDLASRVLAVLNLRGALHCPTCQCNKIHPTMPVDQTGKPRSRSWHHDTLLPENDVGEDHAGPDRPAGTNET